MLRSTVRTEVRYSSRRVLSSWPNFALNADALKAGAALAALDRVAFGSSSATSADIRRMLLDEMDALLVLPGMHRLAEMRAMHDNRDAAAGTET